MPTFTLFVAYEHIVCRWTVRRARTVVAVYGSREAAMRGARGLALALRERLHCQTHIEVEEPAGEICSVPPLPGWPNAALAADLP